MNLYRKFSKSFFVSAQLFLIAFVSITAAQAQSSSVDLSFNAIVSKDDGFRGFRLQPDGKILVYGRFQAVNGVIKNYIARLNPDGSLDNSFNCDTCDFPIGSALVQPDGKIVIADAIVRRLNADGSIDASFTPTTPLNNSSPEIQAIQSDGKLLVSYRFFSMGFTQESLRRLNADGTFDNTFTTINFQGGRLSHEVLTKVVVLPSGKILISTNFCCSASSASVRRYNSDGTLDTTFESPTFTGNYGTLNTGYLVNDFEVLADGSIIIVGGFNTVNAINRVNIAKLQPAGNVDLSFAPPNVFQNREPATGVEIYSDGKILVSTGIVGNPSGPSGTTNRFIRYNADGSLDNTFTSPSSLVLIYDFVIDSSDNVLLYGSFTENGETINKFARLNANGSVNTFLNTNSGIGGSVSTLAIQSDGKVLFAGDFDGVNGVIRRKIARVNGDGSLDTTFNPTVKIDSPITDIAVQSDGKILLGGSFTVNNVSGKGIVRLNSDGSLDASFNPILGITVYSIALQADGKILVGGSFNGVNGQPRIGLVRLNSDGTTDESFNPAFAANSVIRSIAVQADGKILVGGTFNGVNGFARQNLVRLNADGSLDAAFNAGNIQPVKQVEILSDGKYLVLTTTLVRLNNNGMTDAAFQSPSTNAAINTFLVQPDGSIIIGGDFTSVNNVIRSRLARLRANGSLDRSFFPSGADKQIRAIVRQADGRIIVGGDFTRIEDTTRLGIARLIVSPVRAPFTPFDFDGDGRADIAVFRPSNGTWYQMRSQNNSFFAMRFGQSGDRIAPADYDGDGKTDIAVFRDSTPGAGNFAYFYIFNSSDNSFRPVQFGSTGDVPVSGDWDGDAIADLAVYRDGSSTGGQSYFFYRPSSQPGVNFLTIPLGGAGDKPVVGDFDGDGRQDAAVFHPSNGTWYVRRSSNNQVTETNFGVATDIPVPADYNGDGLTDFAVFRPSNGTWYIARPAGVPAQNFDAVRFGAQGDLTVPADYDGDGKADLAVYRPSEGAWYLLRSTEGFTGLNFGISEDKPIPNAYVR